jgi:hypothetical protein
MKHSRKIPQAKSRKVTPANVRSGARALAGAMVSKVAGRKNAKAKLSHKGKKY